MGHLKQVHESEGASVTCPVNECDALYSKVNSLCSHVYRKHRGSTVSRPFVPGASRSENDFELATDFNFPIPSSIVHDVNQLVHRDAAEQKKKSALFLLQLKEERMITQAAINDVVSGCREVFYYTMNRFKAGIDLRLARSGIEPEVIMDVFQIPSKDWKLRICRINSFLKIYVVL